MASKLSKLKVKGQRSVLNLVKCREVTDLHSDDNNSDILSENELERPSAQKLFELTPGRKRKERSPQETTNNPYKKINMGDTDIGNMKMEQELTEEEEKEIESLSPELAKVTKILLRRNEHRFTELRNDMSTLIRNAEILQEQQNQIELLKRENSEMQLRCTKLETDQHRLRSKLSKIENELLESTAIIHGIHEDSWEEGSTRYNMVVDVLAYTMMGSNHHEQMNEARKILIKKTSRIGKYNPYKGRPISVTFVYNEDCEHLLANKKYLPKGVFADKQYCAEIENTRRILRPVIRKARRGKYKGRCRMERDQIVIDGKRYGLRNLHQLPSDLTTFKCTSAESEDCIGFFGELNGLSNFHPCKFEINGIKYSSSEQWIQHCKAKYFKDTITMAQILSTETALDSKLLARDIAGYDERRWKEVAYKECYKGLFEKFAQNEEIKQVLVNTGNKRLVESSYDQVWGTGIPLNDPSCLDRSKWTSPGILSKLLMDIRSKLRPDTESPTTGKGELMDVTSKKQDEQAD